MSAGSEREVLETFLDLYRAVVTRKLANLSDVQIRQRHVPWIYVHMIEERARHVGHADILREQTDGATGFDG